VSPVATVPAPRGEKLWKTTISTTATTTQSSRFLVKSFILIGSGVPCFPACLYVRAGVPASLLHPRQLALAEGIDFRRTLARGRRLADGDLLVAASQLAHVVVESHPLEQLDQEGAARAQVVVGELQRQLGQVHGPRLVDRVHATHIGGHVRKDKVDRLAVEKRLQLG